MDNTVYWIWLSLALTIGSESFKRLIGRFDSARDVYDADETELRQLLGKRTKDLEAVCDKDLTRASEILEFCQSKSVGILTYSDDRYPEALRRIDNPPVLLYYRGILPDFNSECFVAVVGTRRLSDYGRKNAFEISRGLAEAGAVIVSGMALGIDGVAHAGALSGGKSTVAVIGSGIDVCYPPEHLTLARSIVKQGCIMTEYAPGTAPDGKNFPRRNRIISGISSSVVVIEGRMRSGSLITARCARM